MSDERLASTVGAPTPDNYEEIIELSYQLNLLSSAKNTWTSSGILVSQLRTLLPGSEFTSNPFALGPEAAAFLRQVIGIDGVVILELLREICASGTTVSRDALALLLPEIVDRAITSLKEGHLTPADLRKLRDTSKTLHSTLEKRKSASSAPGVLEHRISPRLEWLTDFGYLSKVGHPKNGFEYVVEPFAHKALAELDSLHGRPDWGDSFAVWDWTHNPVWEEPRRAIPRFDADQRVIRAYGLLQRRIGPSPIRDIAFAAALHSNEPLSYKESVDELIYFANVTPGVSLSGGRYVRSPENIYIPNQNSQGI